MAATLSSAAYQVLELIPFDLVVVGHCQAGLFKLAGLTCTALNIIQRVRVIIIIQNQRSMPKFCDKTSDWMQPNACPVIAHNCLVIFYLLIAQAAHRNIVDLSRTKCKEARFKNELID